MDNRFFNSLKNGFQALKDSARSLGTSFNPISPTNTNYTSDNEETITEEQVEGVDAARKKRKEKANKHGGKEKHIDVDLPHAAADQILQKTFHKRKYRNWIKVGIALRLVCEYIRPVIKDVVEKMHKQQLSRRGEEKILPSMIYLCRNGYSNGGQLLQDWLEDIKKLYRKDEKRPNPTAKELFTMCRATEWPESEGAWEFARAFMTRGYRCGGYKSDAKWFDLYSLLNFMQNCMEMEKYIEDLDRVWQVSRVRNSVMHNVMMEVDLKIMDENFDRILDLLQDVKLRKATLKHNFPASDCIESVKRLKVMDFDMKESISSSPSTFQNTDVTEEDSSTGLFPSSKASIMVAQPHVNSDSFPTLCQENSSQTLEESLSESLASDIKSSTESKKRKNEEIHKIACQVSAKQMRSDK